MALPTLIALAVAQAAAPAPAPAATMLVVISYRQGPNWVAGQPMERQKLLEHFRYMQGLQRDGVLVGGGPLMGENAGMAIVRVPTLAAAQAILAADPAVTTGVFTASAQAWQIRVGTRTLPQQ